MIRFLLKRLFPFGDKGRILACREVTPRLSEFLDKELDSETIEKIRAHLDVCSACRRFVKSLENTSQLLRKDPASPIPEDAAQKLMDSLKKEYRRAHEELDEKKSE